MKKCTKSTAKKAAEAATAKKPRAKKACACKKAAAKATTTPQDGKKDVTFVLRDEAGKNVLLAGCFTDWIDNAKKMTYKNGLYTVTVRLAPGTYQYKFVIDGVWTTDDQNMNQVKNDVGTFNNVLEVK